jgi:hypothetical protein
MITTTHSQVKERVKEAWIKHKDVVRRERIKCYIKITLRLYIMNQMSCRANFDAIPDKVVRFRNRSLEFLGKTYGFSVQRSIEQLG